ncbi:MAG: DegT/DnrJ/EryC1/StrS family aminotransferase, partial [Spirochaetota bacterium]
TATAVLMANATPVFVDIDPNTNCINPEKIKEAISERTKAIIVVHMAGLPADMDQIMELAGQYNLKVIEDAAQAHGSAWKGRRLGSLGNAASFSFQLSKNMTSGEGGIITTNDEYLAQQCWSIHHVGRKPDSEWYRHYRLSSNYRMTDWQAAVLLVQLDRLEKQIELREQNAAYLDTLLSGLPGISLFQRDKRVTRHTYHLYMFKFHSENFNDLTKEKFIAGLNAEGIPASPGYIELHKQPLFQDTAVKRILTRQIDYASVNLPETEKTCRQTVWIPQNVLLGTKRDMEDIASAIQKIQHNAGELLL